MTFPAACSVLSTVAHRPEKAGASDVQDMQGKQGNVASGISASAFPEFDYFK